MSKVVVFIPQNDTDGARNLRDFVSFARDELTLFEDQGGFLVDKWEYKSGIHKTSVQFSQAKMQKRNLGQRENVPFEQPFMDFAKAYIRTHLTKRLTTAITKNINALRYVYAALVEIHGIPDILKLDGIVQGKAVELIEANGRMGPAALYRFGQALEKLYDDVRVNKIVIDLPIWRNPWSRPRERSMGTSEKDKKWQEERCPSMHEMMCVMDAFNRAETVPDKYATSLIIMLIFAPGRVSELNHLTHDCLTIEEYEESGETKRRMGVRWHSAKGYGETVKWVPKVMEPVVEMAIGRLREISEEPRKAAAFYNENESGFFVHERCLTSSDFNQCGPLNGYQINAALGLTAPPKVSDASLKNTENIPKSIALGTNFGSPELNKHFWDHVVGQESITYEDLGDLARRMLPRDFPNISGTQIKLKDSLVVTWEFATNRQYKTRPYKLVVPTFASEFVNHALARRHNKSGGRSASIFDIFDLKNEDGSEVRLTSHQLRVWLSTNAERGNMESLELAQWAGRLRIDDNRHYDLRTPAEREQQEREVLDLLPASQSALQQAKLNGPVSYEALGHKDRLGMAEITKWGFCEHDFAMEPCTKGGNCLTCKEHCVIKGLSDNLEKIRLEEKLVEAEFDRAREAEGLNYFGASRWVDHLGYRLALIRTQRLRLEDPETPEGSIIRIPDEYDTSQTKRALQNAGYETEIVDLADEKLSDDYLRGLLSI
ncbi:hypothetical protein PH7735_02403 [Shimia thalassica]|uniref:Integrase n=1 Tax=Shimia thalassica TaxID=1715693 RepID=A0A0P1IJE0_9RHOB|nr:hypothetical protein [Shimia thalassica]CUK01025.1 hypothetical protein PH7735_02403 [Shimia thalassica]